VEYGGNNRGTTTFGMEYPESLGVRHGDTIDALLLNGTKYGGNGGADPVVVSLDDDDYWNSFKVNAVCTAVTKQAIGAAA
jgi:hypothetical protein